MSRRGTSGVRRRKARRLLVGIGAVLALTIVVPTGTAAAVPPPPPNPSDSDLSAASSLVTSQLGQVSDLINQVASANQQLAQLDDQVAIKREDVNKALVDLGNARDAADAAARVVGIARQALTDAGAQISQAQAKFNDFAVSSYTKGTTAASIATLLGSQGPDDVLERAQVLQVIAGNQNAVLDNLQRARTEQANRDSTARDSKAQADSAAAAAESKKSDAEQAIAAANAALQEQAEQKAQIETQRDTAQTQLDAAKTDVAGLQTQRAAYTSWDQQRQAEAAAAAAATAAAESAAKQAAVQAAARVAANSAALAAAAAIADEERSHTDVTDDSASDSSDASTSSGTGSEPDTSTAAKSTTTPKSTTSPKTTTPKSTTLSNPSLTGSAAVELVVDRGMSQLGVQYSWGGGNAKGPTKGIHDGGVADSYGDYKIVGFDCSGLMMYAFAGLGISLPHYTGYQYTAGKQVPSAQMRRGDMIFYGPNASQHVALYLGDGKMLEAPQSGDVVKVSPVRTSGMTPYVVRMVA